MLNYYLDDDDKEDQLISSSKSLGRRVFEMVVLIILYLAAVYIQVYFSDMHDEYFGGVRAEDVPGIFSAVQVLLLVAMVISSKIGYYAGLIISSLNLIYLILTIVLKQSYNGVVGGCIIISGMVIIWMIHMYLKKLERKEKQLYDIVHTDILTELPNRRAFKSKLSEVIEESRIKNQKFAIAIMDLDNFKNINDTIGHDYGDKVLSTMANRWRDVTNRKDFISRLGGDEFAVIISDYEAIAELDAHLHEFMDVLENKITLKGKEFTICGSMGVSVFPSDSLDSSQLMKFADTALYAAKNQGKNRICYFDGIMNDVLEHVVEMENVIRYAIKNDAFSLVYQPQYSIKDKKLRGFETLIRLHDEKGGPLSPGAFIPVAEKSTLIIEVDRWVLRNAMHDFKPLLEKAPDVILSINISATHMLADGFLDDVDSALKETNFPPENLELELTESVFVDSLEKAKSIMREIKDRGIHIALDDFGTGYSSLSYLKELPIDLLKIDKAFVDSITDGPKEESFVAAIISLSQLMQFAVISEGVEEEYQLDILRNLGCDYIQGFLWGKPQVINDAAILLS